MLTFTPLGKDELFHFLGLQNHALSSTSITTTGGQSVGFKQRKAAYDRVQHLEQAEQHATIQIPAHTEQEIMIITSKDIPADAPCVIEIEAAAHTQLKLTYFEDRLLTEHSLVALKITLHESAHLELLTAFTGALSSSLFLDVIHAGAGSTSTQKTIFFADQKQQLDIFSNTVLDAPDTTTNITAKGVLNHEAQARFDGAINITHNGNNGSGHLHEHTLLLSPLARVSAIPALKIEHNNVQASHSASVTRVDDEHLFYCGARGIDEESATRLIVDGFLGDIYRSTNLAEALEPLIADKIAHLAA